LKNVDISDMKLGLKFGESLERLPHNLNLQFLNAYAIVITYRKWKMKKNFYL